MYYLPDGGFMLCQNMLHSTIQQTELWLTVIVSMCGQIDIYIPE